MKIRFLLLGTSLSLIPNLTFAQCVATQDCATLGYTETSCSGGSGVKCPFGNKWACFKSESEICNDLGFTLSCTGTNQTGGSGKACNGKYTACTCASGYEWKDDNCKIQNGAQGDLYYCNGKVVGVKASSLSFYISMKDLGNMTWSNANSACLNYSFCDSIKGNLPTQYQLKSIYNNKSQINTILSANGGTQLENSYYWSSTSSVPGDHPYILHMSNGNLDWYGDNYNAYVRPILSSY